MAGVTIWEMGDVEAGYNGKGEEGDGTIREPVTSHGNVKAHAERAEERRRELSKGMASDTAALLDLTKTIRWTEAGDMANIIHLIPGNKVLPALATLMARPFKTISSFRIAAAEGVRSDKCGKGSGRKPEFEDGLRKIIGVCAISGGQVMGEYVVPLIEGTARWRSWFDV
jgi:hypothetical protein